MRQPGRDLLRWHDAPEDCDPERTPLLDALIDEVSEESGKSLTATHAAILIQDSKALMMKT